MTTGTAVAAAPGLHAMDITIYRTAEGQTWFRAAVLRLVGGRMRLTLDGRPELSEVFRDGVGEKLQEICANASSDKTAVSLPDLIVSAGAAVTQGCTVMVTAWKDGIQQITLAFRKILGDPFSLFRHDAIVFAGADSRSEILQETAAHKLLAPFADLAGALAESLRGRDAAFASEKMREVRRILETQAHMLRSLLTQIVDEAGRGILGPPSDQSAVADEEREKEAETG